MKLINMVIQLLQPWCAIMKLSGPQLVVGVSGTAILCIEHTPTYPSTNDFFGQKVKGFVDNLTILSS